jgi:hypothetical protein
VSPTIVTVSRSAASSSFMDFLVATKPELKVRIAGEERLRSRDGKDSSYGPGDRVGGKNGSK